MKKYLCLLGFSLLCATAAMASPGDTTWVQANSREFTHDPGTSTNWYGNYDTTVSFPAPGTTYRKIYMIFTLGKYSCPAGAQYCYQWDYTVQNFLMTSTGDTVELGRFITPYVGAGNANFPLTWTHRYIYDVTDFASLLAGTAGMRMFYSGYSGGFTGDIKFAFIEGTPERNTLGYAHLWDGSFQYGNSGSPINNNFPAATLTAPAGTQTADLKFTVTGHGSDANGCCEFAPHNYQVLVNGTQIANTSIWRADCGFNEIYPQTGTWIYDRANWCPGTIVNPIVSHLTGVTPGTPYTAAVTFDPYTIGSNYGSYTTEANVFYHGAINKTLDASLDDIIAPTNNENYFRENPMTGKPVVHVRNTGSTAITSLKFEYSIDNGNPGNYYWTGTIASLTDADITLNQPWDLYVTSGVSGNHTFSVKIIEVNNNTGDDDITNNSLSSTFIAAPKWPLQFLVNMKTNNEGTGGNSETTWQILDIDNNVVAQRMISALSTQYVDTVTLGLGIYHLVISDGSCDGLHWWVNDQTGAATAGTFTVKKLTGQNIPMNGYIASGTYANDFGCGYTQYFQVDFPTAVTNVSATPLSFETYPNPAQNNVNISINGLTRVNGTVRIIDALGRTVIEQHVNDAHESINVSTLANGLYTVLYVDETAPASKLQSRLVIAK